MERIVSAVVIGILFPEIPSKKERLSKNFKKKFGKLYSQELAMYIEEDQYDGPGEPTSVTDGREMVHFLKSCAELINTEGPKFLERWMDFLLYSEEDGPRNHWLASVEFQVALLCLEELGVPNPWEYRHAALRFPDEYRDGEICDES